MASERDVPDDREKSSLVPTEDFRPAHRNAPPVRIASMDLVMLTLIKQRDISG